MSVRSGRRRGDGEGAAARLGTGAAGSKGSGAAGVRPPKSPGGKRAGEEGPQEPGRGAGGGAVRLDFFGKGLPGSLLVLCQAPASSA